MPRTPTIIRSAEEFYRLRTSENPEEYLRAAHGEASEAVWLDVIRTYPDMKVWVVHIKKVPLSILRLLADDPDPVVRRWIVGKGKIDEGLMEKFSNDPDEGIRSVIAGNHKVPRQILERLSKDPSDYVRKAARENPQYEGDS